MYGCMPGYVIPVCYFSEHASFLRGGCTARYASIANQLHRPAQFLCANYQGFTHDNNLSHKYNADKYAYAQPTSWLYMLTVLS